MRLICPFRDTQIGFMGGLYTTQTPFSFYTLCVFPPKTETMKLSLPTTNPYLYNLNTVYDRQDVNGIIYHDSNKEISFKIFR